MKKISKILAVILLTACTLIYNQAEVNAIVFSDVSETHWAKDYIYAIEKLDIINGYEDGTFKPEHQLKKGEFIKMIAMAYFNDFNYVAPSPDEPDGNHWAKPYVMALDKRILKASDYSDYIVEQTITREEAAELICKFYILINSNDESKNKYDRTEKYLEKVTDVNEIDNSKRLYVNNNIRYGIINGFEDGSFRPKEGLTRAQAAKIIYTALSK